MEALEHVFVSTTTWRHPKEELDTIKAAEHKHQYPCKAGKKSEATLSSKFSSPPSLGTLHVFGGHRESKIHLDLRSAPKGFGSQPQVLGLGFGGEVGW